MEQALSFLEKIFSINVFGNMNLYEVLSTIFKYLFVIIVFYFIYSIIKVIYYDVRGTMMDEKISDTYLKLLSGNRGLKFKVQEYYFIGDDNSIGRDDSNTISIKDKFMSKKHARIIKEDGMYFLEDENSANGTYLNGERISDAIELQNNDIINIGQLEFLFVEGDSDGH
ncbi:MAG: FHA domain-containing protein [Tissierellia bacterium]|nr:FHA domain-containing protein [Tissierellia bacterium]